MFARRFLPAALLSLFAFALVTPACSATEAWSWGKGMGSSAASSGTVCEANGQDGSRSVDSATERQETTGQQDSVLSPSTEPVIPAEAMVVLVTDPLSSRIACNCVGGYAQRNYDKLGEFLQTRIGRPVVMVYGESVAAALEKSGQRADAIIGKHSVILSAAESNGWTILPVAQLADRNESVTQTGLFVVRAANPAQSVADLKGYRILLGPAACDEKHAAPVEFLAEHGISVPESIAERETCPTCSHAAKSLMEFEPATPVAAVISSYAIPLLEGCGNVKKGDLRVIGESQPVPFITVFANQTLADSDREKLTAALLEVELDAALLEHLESATGFVPWHSETAASEEKAGGDSVDGPAGSGKKKSR